MAQKDNRQLVELLSTWFVRRNELSDNGGWIPAGETWTYASSTTVTISGDKTAKYSKGMKVKLTQTSVKYFYITGVSYSSPNTTLTLNAGTDYTVANAAITSPFYSMAANPAGFPGTFAYDGAPYGSSGSLGTYAEDIVIQKFSLINSTVKLQNHRRITNKGSWSGDVKVPLPITRAVANLRWDYNAVIIPSGSITIKAIGELLSAATNITMQNLLLGANLQWSAVSTNDLVIISIEYLI